MISLKHVLIVDDDPILCKMLDAYFQKRGVAKRSISKDGNEARNAFRSEGTDTDIDLITCDLSMPNSDGIELLDFLRTRHSRIPLLIITAAPDFIAKSAESLSTVYRLNLIGVLAKPATEQKLDQALLSLPSS